MRLSKNIFYNLYSSLGVCTYFLPDSLSNDNKIKFLDDEKIEIKYTENEEKILLDKKIEKELRDIYLKCQRFQ